MTTLLDETIQLVTNAHPNTLNRSYANRAEMRLEDE